MRYGIERRKNTEVGVGLRWLAVAEEIYSTKQPNACHQDTQGELFQMFKGMK